MIAVPPAQASRPGSDTTGRKGPAAPGANVLKEGFRTPIPRVPEDADAVNQQSRIYFHSLNPRNDFHAWLVEDTALCTLRLDRIARIERRERDRIALRAEHFWDVDRRSEVEALGARLGSHPAATVRALERTPHGCDWLMARWALLARAYDRNGAWDEAQTTLAFDLLGTPHALREGAPGEPVDLHGRTAGGPGGDLAAMARGQVDRLLVVRASVEDADALDRALAMADMGDATSPELRRLRRYEATLHKRMRWNLHQLQQEPKWAAPHPDLKYLYDTEPGPVAEEPPPSETPAVADAGPSGVVAVEEPAVVEPDRRSRPDPITARVEARRQARRQKADRLRS